METTTGTVPQDTTPATEVQAPEPAQDMTLDELLGINEEVDPYFTDDAQHKGQKPLHEWLPHLPDEVRRNLANLRSSVTRKQQELSELKRELEAQQQEFQRQRELLVNSPWAKQLSELAQASDEPIDPWTEEGMQKLVQSQMAQQFQKMIEPLKQEAEIQAQRIKAQEFVAAHPDAKSDPELKHEIAKLLVERNDLTLEDAYWLCKGRLLEARARQQAQQQAMQRSQAREVLSRTSTGAATTAAGKPTFRDARGRFDPYAVFEYHKARLGDKAYTQR